MCPLISKYFTSLIVSRLYYSISVLCIQARDFLFSEIFPWRQTVLRIQFNWLKPCFSNSWAHTFCSYHQLLWTASEYKSGWWSFDEWRDWKCCLPWLALLFYTSYTGLFSSPDSGTSFSSASKSKISAYFLIKFISLDTQW